MSAEDCPTERAWKAVLFANLYARPLLVWQKVPGFSGAVGVNARGNGIALSIEERRVRADLVRHDGSVAATYTAHRLVSARSGEPAKLGSMPAAMEQLENVVMADGRLPRRLAWVGYTPPSLQLGDWQPGRVDRGTVEVHMRGRRGLWIASRWGGGFAASLNTWLNFQAVGEDQQPLDLGSWFRAMEYCEEQDAQ